MFVDECAYRRSQSPAAGISHIEIAIRPLPHDHNVPVAQVAWLDPIHLSIQGDGIEHEAHAVRRGGRSHASSRSRPHATRRGSQNLRRICGHRTPRRSARSLAPAADCPSGAAPQCRGFIGKIF